MSVMERNLSRLAAERFDVAVVGGGIYGACIAWEGITRGLSVALVEKADFASATSANSLKIIHGGLRYLQNADLRRLRHSARERSTLMWISPHLVHPLPVVVPTYGYGRQGRIALWLALKLNDMLTFDRNRSTEADKYIPGGRTFSPGDARTMLPGVADSELSGAALFYDAQVYNSERLVVSFLRSAAGAGACIANYVEATALLQEGETVTGLRVRDQCSGDGFDLRARMVVNAAGPWLDRWPAEGDDAVSEGDFAKAINLVLDRELFPRFAVGLPERPPDTDERGRYLFFTPWRGKTIAGTAYFPFAGSPDECNATQDEIRAFLHTLNRTYPPAGLRAEDIVFVHCGLVPTATAGRRTDELSLATRDRIIDHSRAGVRGARRKGLISVLGVKYTTARAVAEVVVDTIFEQWDVTPPPSRTATTPLYGGQIERFDEFVRTAVRRRPHGLSAEQVRRLIHTYGSAYENVLRYVDRERDGTLLSKDLALLRAEVLHAINEEMACRLGDILLRRTDVGSAGHPGSASLRFCARIMAEALNWNEARMLRELNAVQRLYPQTERAERDTALARSPV